MPIGMDIPHVLCTKCGHVLNAASNQHEGVPRPSPGDFTICLYCDHLMTFKDDLTVRDCTDAEVQEANENPEVAEVRQMVQMYRMIYHKDKSDDRRASDKAN